MDSTVQLDGREDDSDGGNAPLIFGHVPEHRNQQRKQTLAGRPFQSCHKSGRPPSLSGALVLPHPCPLFTGEKSDPFSVLLQCVPRLANGLSIITNSLSCFAISSETLRPSTGRIREQLREESHCEYGPRRRERSRKPFEARKLPPQGAAWKSTAHWPARTRRRPYGGAPAPGSPGSRSRRKPGRSR